MDEIVVRDVRQDEAKHVMEMTRLMVLDMQRYGGRIAATDESVWNKIAVDISEELSGDQHKYFIAETANFNRIGISGARVVTLGGAFAPKKIVHLSVVYVLPDYRRLGVATKLISRTLEWGHILRADYFDLNVLVANPARSLYQRFGFSEVAVNMIKLIQD